MYFQHESNFTLDLDNEVDQKVLLSIVSKLSVFALHSVDKLVKLERIKQTISLMSGLCYLHLSDNHEKLVQFQKDIHRDALEILSQQGDSVLLEFSNAFKTALDILDTKDKTHCDDWQRALIDKLKETKKLLQSKSKSIKIELQRNSRESGFVFFDEQQKDINRSSSRGSTSTIGINGEK